MSICVRVRFLTRDWTTFLTTLERFLAVWDAAVPQVDCGWAQKWLMTSMTISTDAWPRRGRSHPHLTKAGYEPVFDPFFPENRDGLLQQNPYPFLPGNRDGLL